MKQKCGDHSRVWHRSCKNTAMKSLYSDLHPNPGTWEGDVRAAERFQKICIVFEDDDSARSVKIH